MWHGWRVNCGGDGEPSNFRPAASNGCTSLAALDLSLSSLPWCTWNDSWYSLPPSYLPAAARDRLAGGRLGRRARQSLEHGEVGGHSRPACPAGQLVPAAVPHPLCCGSSAAPLCNLHLTEVNSQAVNLIAICPGPPCFPGAPCCTTCGATLRACSATSRAARSWPPEAPTAR